MWGILNKAMVVQLDMAAIFYDKPGEHLAKYGVQVFHLALSIWLFEGNGDKVEEGIDEGGVHVYDVVALFEGHAVGDLDVGMIVSVGGPTVFGIIGNFRGKWIVRIGVCLAAGIVPVEGGIDGNVQEIHLFGYRGRWVWAHLHIYWRRLFRTKRLVVPKLGSGGVGKARRIVAAGVSA
jgi:hypothetical protein